MFSLERLANWLFRLAAACAAFFVLTVLMLAATAFSTVKSPSAEIVDRHGLLLAAIGVIGTLAFGLAAMIADRVATLRAAASAPPRPPAKRHDSPPSDGADDADRA